MQCQSRKRKNERRSKDSRGWISTREYKVFGGDGPARLVNKCFYNYKARLSEQEYLFQVVISLLMAFVRERFQWSQTRRTITVPGPGDLTHGGKQTTRVLQEPRRLAVVRTAKFEMRQLEGRIRNFPSERCRATIKANKGV